MSLRAAACLVDVTPPDGGPLVGYGDRGPSTGVIASIEAGLLVVESEGVGWVIVTLDAVGVGHGVAARLRELVGEVFGWSSDVVMVSCTHNHAGPDWFDDADSSEIERMTNLVVAAASGLRHDLTPVTASVAAGETDIAVNRRELDADGRAVMGTNESGPRDTRITTLVLRRDDGSALATLTVAALHGNCLKGDNTCLAPDFVGPFRAAVRESTGAPVLFVQGCAGDLNPRWRGGVAEAERTGRTLARDVLATLERAEPLAPRVAAASMALDVPMAPRPSAEEARAMAEAASREWEADASEWLAWHARETHPHPTLPATLTVVRVGDLVIGGVPWELFSSIGVRARSALGARSLLCGYVNGYYGYLAEPHDIARGGYEIEWMPVVYGLGTGMPLPMGQRAADVVLDAFSAVCRATEGG